ncbi:Mur ligase [Candidatus Saccharibacteria bacterium]|nr:Mur ligase [Candidatus Saccharibacteria bacterium]
MRDQLDRFGEIDATAKLLAQVAEHTQKGLILNREDPRIRAIATVAKKNMSLTYFGLSDALLKTFPNDDDMRKSSVKAIPRPAADVLLQAYQADTATFSIDEQTHKTTLKINGLYNVFNAAAAIATTKAVLQGNFDAAKAIDGLANVSPAFGRGETLMIGGQPLELVLVKNPSGFRLGLQSFPPEGHATMIAINDNYADGRDMSWLWDVDFESLAEVGVSQVSGVRAYDMALRLQYDEVTIAHIEPDLALAIRQFIATNPDTPKRIYCTYTAMLALRKELAKMTQVEVIA